MVHSAMTSTEAPKQTHQEKGDKVFNQRTNLNHLMWKRGSSVCIRRLEMPARQVLD